MTDVRFIGALDRHSKSAILALAAIAVMQRILLAVFSPWSFGYVWDLYHEVTQRIWTTGSFPASTDCWECWQPPVLFLAARPLYALGRFFYPTSPWPDDYALRFASVIPFISGLACLYFSYRLLYVVGLRGTWLVLAFALVTVFPCLFFSTYAFEPDIVLAALLIAFLYYLTRGFLRESGWTMEDAVVLGGLAGIAAETKFNGLVAIVLGTLVLATGLARKDQRQRSARVMGAFLVIALLVGSWKYIDNTRRYGTPLFAVGTAISGFSVSQRVWNTEYEFTTFRLRELMALTRPDAPPGMLTDLPVYRSVWTTLHGLSWGDMGFFSNPTRHGTRFPFYSDRHVQPWLASTVLVLGVVPSVLAVGGFLMTVGRREYLPLTLAWLLGWVLYFQHMLSQQIWGLKVKYLLFLVPIYALYCVIALRGAHTRLPSAVSAAMLSSLILLVAAAEMYLLLFAVG
jgi:4-amino-4-deoxy-L-arabinose transferase-like glycosyltransferase